MKYRSLSNLLSIGLLALVAVVVPPQPGFAAQEHMVPFGTAVDAVLEYPLVSSQLHDGDEIPIRVARNVVEDGYVVIRAGARGIAEVIINAPATEGRQSGGIMLQLKWVRAVDHTRIGVNGFATARGGDRSIGVWADAVTQGSDVAGNAGAFRTQAALGGAGAVLESVAGAEKGGEAVIDENHVIRGEIANMWGVSIESNIQADPEDAPIR